MLKLTERIRSSPYYPALVHPVFRRVLPGAAASALGDGMSAVAIAWLALKLAPAGSRGLWVGAAVAAYTLPGAVGAIALRRWLSRRHGAGLVIVNAVLRGVALGLVGCLALAGLLDPPGYVVLLGVSSLLSAWGVAGKYTLIADLFPADQRVAGNTVFSLADQLSLMIGPALAGVVTALAGPAVVIALDAASWALLAVSYASAARLLRALPPSAPSSAPSSAGPDPSGRPRGGWAMISSAPVLAGLLALTFVFYLLYGPLEVALPVHVATDLHGSAALLGVYWAVFGVGAIMGELAAPYLRRLPVWPTMTGIVFGWGLALVPLGLPAPLWAGLAAFFAGGVIFGPWMSLSMGVFQDASPPGTLAQVLAARSSLLILAAPIGTALGGPLVTALGARGTLLLSALATIALGLITAIVLSLCPPGARARELLKLPSLASRRVWSVVFVRSRRTFVTGDTGPAPTSYCMVAAAMSLELHGCGIHAVWCGARVTGVTDVRFSRRPAPPASGRWLPRRNPITSEAVSVRTFPFRTTSDLSESSASGGAAALASGALHVA